MQKHRPGKAHKWRAWLCEAFFGKSPRRLRFSFAKFWLFRNFQKMLKAKNLLVKGTMNKNCSP